MGQKHIKDFYWPLTWSHLVLLVLDLLLLTSFFDDMFSSDRTNTHFCLLHAPGYSLQPVLELVWHQLLQILLVHLVLFHQVQRASIYLKAIQYTLNDLRFQTLFSVSSNKMNSKQEDTDQTEEANWSESVLFRHFWQASSDQNFRTSAVPHNFISKYRWN